ncbi:MAG: polyprenyl synthetase family protein [Acidisphaera sp.]|nr:polyprenyl synthetase family protein [Acidisphaera sp.]
MDIVTRIERALQAAVGRADDDGGPPRLAAAMRHAVFPRGARIRPRLCLAVAGACGDRGAPLADATAAAIELLHCASLVHDDLPCFDDAATRRGRPSVHRAFGEPLAVLAGDALIVAAFQILASHAAETPERLPAVVAIVAASVGAPHGIAAGQAWECEKAIDLSRYQRAKTGALFGAATVGGAAAAGCEHEPWRPVGELLGEAYQVADDIRDCVGDAEALGKPVGQDAARGRPSAVQELGLAGAVDRLEALAAEAARAVPPCPHAGELRALIRQEASRLLPKELASQAA